MKFNKWTLGLAAVGAVSLASVVNAEEKTPTFLETAVSGTQISGYVNVSAHWNPGSTGGYDHSGYTTGANPGYAFNAPAKNDGFNLNAVLIRIQKPLDETEWASGYNVELAYGADAGSLGTNPNNWNDNQYWGNSFAIKQAYVALRTPIGNGIDWKIGVFDGIIGYESFNAGDNPNYTRSYGYSIEPTTHTGVLASYKFCNVVSATVGVANTTSGPIGGEYGGRAGKAESYKTYMGSITLTAPESWGVLSGSALYGGVIKGAGLSSGNLDGSDATVETVNYYAGMVLNTGVKGLKVGAAYDYRGNNDDNTETAWVNAVALYASFQATEKLSFHARGEYVWQSLNNPTVTTDWDGSYTVNSVYALTATVQYDLWKNVMTRLEARWDTANNSAYNLSGSQASDSVHKDNILLAANIIYKF